MIRHLKSTKEILKNIRIEIEDSAEEEAEVGKVEEIEETEETEETEEIEEEVEGTERKNQCMWIKRQARNQIIKKNLNKGFSNKKTVKIIII